ncbi:hypothetical protein MVEN_02176800 [Mycena venus]|uniref:DUF6534 domain-containing protein n=1 Tax=Mycena venus TaxID=2733690 RepID=A0A8H6X817_9AGAR|nr:hypothetical protein MVEN_02176800 [Mycena venus]
MSDLPPLAAITGPLLIGTWASMLLYMAEAIQAMYYFRHFENDDWKLKASSRARAGIMSRLNVSEGIRGISIHHRHLVFGWRLCQYISLHYNSCRYVQEILPDKLGDTSPFSTGDLAYLAKGNFGTPALLISTGIVAIHVQSFLIIRYWRFTHNTALSVFMGCLALTSLASNLEAGFVVAFFPDLKDHTKVKISSIVCTITEVTTDVLLAASMIRELWRMQSRIPITQHRIKNTVRRIIILSFQSGAAAAGLTITGLITFLAHDKTNIAAGILLTLRRVYILSMLLNLNIRKSTKTETGVVTTSGLRTPGGGTVENSKGVITSIRFNQTSLAPFSHGQTGSEAVTDTFKSMVPMDNIPEEVKMNSISNK